MNFSPAENQVKSPPTTACCRSWAVVRYIAAAIILTAALLKAYQLATVPILGEGFLHHRGFNLFVVGFELFFGIWLLFGLLPKLTWLATTALFLLFALVSFYKAISGEASCGCFGNRRRVKTTKIIFARCRLAARCRRCRVPSIKIWQYK